MEKLTRKPLDVAANFPPTLHNHMSEGAPPPLKMMAARGMVPAPPDITIRVLYNLGFDANAGVAKEATTALEKMPAQVLVPSLQAEQPAEVLDWVAELRAYDDDIIEAILLNKSTADLTVALIASTASTKLCEIVANNQVRILRSPVILEQLYQNTNARMSTVDKLLDLARRNDVELKGLPALQQALKAGIELGGGDGEGEDEFAALLAEEAFKADIEADQAAEEEARLAAMTRSEREREEGRQKKKAKEENDDLPLYARIQKMSISQKVRLATVGSREAVKLLIKEANRLIHMAAIQNPRVQYADVKKFASNKSMPDGVIRYIAGHREWTSHYEVKLSLVNNPKTPVADAMRLLVHIRTNDLRQLQRNRGIPRQVARQAKSLATKRAGGGH